MKRIAIIDSGVKLNHSAFINRIIKGLSLKVDEFGRVIKSDDFIDTIGHGTAIYYLVSKFASNAEITNIKIYDEAEDIDCTKFEIILDYICRKMQFDIINISIVYLNKIKNII